MPGSRTPPGLDFRLIATTVTATKDSKRFITDHQHIVPTASLTVAKGFALTRFAVVTLYYGETGSMSSTQATSGTGTPSKGKGKQANLNSAPLSIQIPSSTDFDEEETALGPPSPVRFISATSAYIFTLRSSGYTAFAALDSLRNLIMVTLGGIVKVSTDYMFQHSLPSIPEAAVASDTAEDAVPEDLITQVVRECKSQGLIVDNRWAGFPEDPKIRYKIGGKDNTENEIYKDFGILWNKIVDVAEPLLPADSDGNKPVPVVRYRSVPDIQGAGERKSEGIKPDAILELVNSSMIKVLADEEHLKKGYCICDAACPVEVKPEDSDEKRLDNVSKLSQHANRYFADDVRRRAVYGIEIENTDFRILNYTRTGVIASQHFNWTKEHESLVRVILSLTFASEEELGYDPNLKRIEVNVPASPATEPKEDTAVTDKQLKRRSQRLSVKKPILYRENVPRKRRKTEQDAKIAYEIVVDGRTFITVGDCIADYRADFFVGRATRVYQVYEKGDPQKNMYVLKLYYVSNDVVQEARVEGNILVQINIKAQELGCSKYFPTVICHGFPLINRKGKTSFDSATLFLRENIVALGFYPGVAVKYTEATQTSSGKTLGSNATRSRGETYTTPSPFTTGIPGGVTTNVHEFLECCFTRRFQYRIVTLEVGASIDTLPDICDVFYAMEETAKALQWLHIIGILHRDLSVGNILYLNLPDDEVTTENRGLRIILNDYDSAKGINKLNPHVAYRTGTPDFMSNELILGFYIFHAMFSSHSDVLDYGLSSSNAQPVEVADDVEEARPFPNFLHEAESLIWIVIWFLCYSVPSGYKAPEEQNRNQMKLIQYIFQQAHATRANSHRLSCFLHSKTLKSYMGMLPADFQELFPHIDRLRALLVKTYREIEANTSFNGALSYVRRRGDDTFYDGIADCFRGCQKVAKGWKSSDIDRFTALPIQKTQPAVEKVNLTDPVDIIQRPRGNSASIIGISSSITGHRQPAA